MKSFEINIIELSDLYDDFMINEKKDLYTFLGPDYVRAFNLGLRLKLWFPLLERKQKHLYSFQIRHTRELIESYINQILYWTNQYEDKGDVNIIDISNFIFDNMIWNNEEDQVKVALYLGMVMGDKVDLSQEEMQYII